MAHNADEETQPHASLSRSRVFVGRERELAVLQGALADATSGRGRLVLLGGEPGIGKTRTAEELTLYAEQAGARILWGRCYEGEGAPAFWPWVQILRESARGLSDDELRELLGADAAEIAQIVPALRRRLPDLPEFHAGESPDTRRRLFDGVAGFLERAAARTPLVLVLDDLHGADRPSLLLLELRGAPTGGNARPGGGRLSRHGGGRRASAATELAGARPSCRPRNAWRSWV